ncbi:hypothetical protein EKL30_03255 [Candidimonas sp. SYP-B2681]|uniref:hypothetical protein n=1 Tax=Candidimonas sp. SYP-B2681 TaxID=2497686 RepID=UPI000F8867A5|nr:hypothetical protein [Candidimonas sp. SYP-B2681]RTZ48006.1 hypothetical protein EKL30_03255 [Candidimonas sp. SYP-B2681]
MRRFIVIFILLLFPVQLLAASIVDPSPTLSEPHHVGTNKSDTAKGDQTANGLPVHADPSSPLQVPADTGDLVDIEIVQCLRCDPPVFIAARYILVAFPAVFLSLLKPPLI